MLTFDAAKLGKGGDDDEKKLMELLGDTESGICTKQGRWGRDLYSFMGIVGDALTGHVWINSAPADGASFERISFDL